MPRALLLVPILLTWIMFPTGCGVIGGSDPEPTFTATATKTATPTSTPTPTMTSTPTVTSTPTLLPTPTPVPVVAIKGSDVVEVAQGKAGVLRIEAEAASATATYRERTITLIPSAGGFWGVIGAGANDETGQFAISVVLHDAAGAVIEERAATLIVYDVGYPVEQITIPPGQSDLLGPDAGAQEEAIRGQVFATSAAERYWSGAFTFPVVGGTISSPYGIGRSYNGAPVSSFHHGSDFAVEEGTPIYASAGGVVAYVGAMPIRGNSLIIDHGAGVFSGYHHLSSVAVAVGQYVGQGALIAYSGMSGLATGPHLHWEVVVHGTSVDPLFWTTNAIGP